MTDRLTVGEFMDTIKGMLVEKYPGDTVRVERWPQDEKRKYGVEIILSWSVDDKIASLQRCVSNSEILFAQYDVLAAWMRNIAEAKAAATQTIQPPVR